MTREERPASAAHSHAPSATTSATNRENQSVGNARVPQTTRGISTAAVSRRALSTRGLLFVRYRVTLAHAAKTALTLGVGAQGLFKRSRVEIRP